MKIKRVQFGGYLSLVGNNPKTVWEAGKDGIGSITEVGGQLVFFDDAGRAIRLVWPPPGTIATPDGSGESAAAAPIERLSRRR